MALRFPRIPVVISSAVLAALFGCSSSTTLGGDAGGPVVLPDGTVLPGRDSGPVVLPDGQVTLPDGQVAPPGDGSVTPRVDAGPAAPVCGNGRLEAGESCDDGNTAAADGCSPTCTREAFCGDRRRDPNEACDDGNNASGDGCSANCQSNESCGNGIRDTASGEVCDDGNMMGGDACAADCRSLLSCGNGRVDTGENCDDGNTTSWDGCGSDCLLERSLRINSLTLGETGTGCDFSGDGRPDNEFARGLGPILGFANMGLEQQVGGGQLNLLLSFLGLDDRTGANDLSTRIAWLGGTPVMGMPGAYTADGASFLMGRPATAFNSSIANRAITGGPEDVNFVLPIMGFAFPLDLRQARISGTTVAATTDLSGINAGQLCGAIPLSSLDALPNFLSLIGGGGGPIQTPTEACDGTQDLGTLADLLVGGYRSFGIQGVRPDVDLNNDGLETFEVDRSGVANCQPVITACILGNGTRIARRGCVAQTSDGLSAVLPYTAIAARITGIR